MVSKTVARALAIVVSLAFLLVGSPALAGPVSLRWFAQQNLRLQTIAYRINVATAADCPDPRMMTGLLLHDLTTYDRDVRPAVSRAFSLGTGIGIIQIVPGSAADRAGLRIDDEILAVNGSSVEDPSVIGQPRKTYRRVEGFTRALQAALRNGPAELLVRRNGTLARVRLAGELGCGGEASLRDSTERNAWSDGDHVVVTTAMTNFARSDDELAFVLAHEMAHNVLGHSRHSSRGIFGFSFGGKRQELAADYMAVWLMTEGGYKAEGGISFLQDIGRKYRWNLTLDHPGFGTRIKIVAGAVRSAAYSPLWAQAHHVPAAAPPPPNAQPELTIALNDPSPSPPEKAGGEATQFASESGASSGADPPLLAEPLEPHATA